MTRMTGRGASVRGELKDEAAALSISRTHSWQREHHVIDTRSDHRDAYREPRYEEVLTEISGNQNKQLRNPAKRRDYPCIRAERRRRPGVPSPIRFSRKTVLARASAFPASPGEAR